MNETPATIFELAMTSWARTQQTMVGQFEKWTALRLESLRAYVDLGLAQVKVALKVTDPRGLHEFADSQCAVLSFVSHRMVDDGRMLAEWSADSYRQADRVARQNLLALLFK